MGTVVSFAIVTDDEAGARAAIAGATTSLHDIDQRFSPYRDDSDVSRIARGELDPDDADADMAEVMRLGQAAIDDSDGAFTLHPGGRFDPSGVVKGWAIERASSILSAAGFPDHLVNGGGDVQARGDREPGPVGQGRPWRIAIADPRGLAHPIASVGASGGLAVATSGTAERGAHIEGADAGILSITVVGPSITEVDIAATTAFALGDDARAWIEARPHLAAIAVLEGSRTWTSSRFGGYTLLP